MAELVEFKLEDGSTVRIQVPGPSSGVTRASGKSIVRKAGSTLESALDSVRSTFMVINSRFKDLSVNETEITASITLTSEGNLIIGKLGGEATLEVKLKWVKAQDE